MARMLPAVGGSHEHFRGHKWYWPTCSDAPEPSFTPDGLPVMTIIDNDELAVGFESQIYAKVGEVGIVSTTRRGITDLRNVSAA